MIPSRLVERFSPCPRPHNTIPIVPVASHASVLSEDLISGRSGPPCMARGDVAHVKHVNVGL